MEQDKVRAEFEAWWIDSKHDGEPDFIKRAMWAGWQASREAVVVELPEWFDRFDSGDRTYWVEDVEKALTAAGIRTK